MQKKSFTFLKTILNFAQQLNSFDQVGFSKRNQSHSENLNLESSKPVIAVIMATSRQGSAVVNHLSKSGIFQVRAITRSPFSETAEKLAKLPNVQVTKGDLLDAESLGKSFKGVYGIFGNTTPTKGWVIGRGSMVHEYEIKQGRNLVDMAKKAADSGSLKHFVFSSVCKAKDPLSNEPAPGHFSSKWNIEEYILTNGLKDHSTMLRPVSYFENFNSDLPGVQISDNSFPGVVRKDKVWQTIAVDDIGLWTNAIFKNPKKFLGKGLNIAGEEMTGEEMAALWQKIKGSSSPYVRYSMVPRKLISLIEHDIGVMANWIERAGYGANMQELQSLSTELGISMTSLSSWLKNKIQKSRPLENSSVTDFNKGLEPIT